MKMILKLLLIATRKIKIRLARYLFFMSAEQIKELLQRKIVMTH